MPDRSVSARSGRRPSRLRRGPFFLSGLTLAALGAVCLLSSTIARQPVARVVGGNLPVDAAATDPDALTALNSPSLTANPVDPKNLAVASRVEAPLASCALHVSFDGGGRWLESPMPAGDQAASFGCLWPHAAFGADGILYVSFTSSVTYSTGADVPGSVWVTTSHDGGRTLSTPVRVTAPLAIEARLVADVSHPERAYLAWVQVSNPIPWGLGDVAAPILVSRSDDGGVTWKPPVVLSDPARGRVVMPSLAAGPSGDLYAAYIDVGQDTLDYGGEHQGRGGEPYQGTWSLLAARSADGGQTWQQSVIDKTLVPAARFLVLTPPRPVIVADGQKGVHVAFFDRRAGSADVWLWNSTDTGLTWTPARRVNDTADKDGTTQYLPQIGVAPNGRLDVVYYDRRADRSDTINEVSFQSSFDGGRTFTHRLRVSDRGFDSRIGAGRDRGLPDLGDRLGLVATNGAALTMWADTRAATDRVAKQDLTRAVIRFRKSVAVPAVMRNRFLGAALTVAGLAALVVAPRRRSGDNASHRTLQQVPTGHLLGELDSRVQPQLGEDVREVDLHGSG